MPDDDFDLELTRHFDAPREAVFRAFVDADQISRWYGPPGFPVPRETVEADARVGGRLRLAMVNEDDPSVRSALDARFTELVDNEVLACTQVWDGVPGAGAWTNQLRVEITDDEGGARLVLREGPHAPGTVELGQQAWNVMLDKLAAALPG
jgi:uncharacterized protein YndB with AHSA1/START domain